MGDYQRDIQSSVPQIHKNFNFQLPFFGFRYNYTRVSFQRTCIFFLFNSYIFLTNASLWFLVIDKWVLGIQRSSGTLHISARVPDKRLAQNARSSLHWHFFQQVPHRPTQTH